MLQTVEKIFSGPGDPDLPDNVKRASLSLRKRWVAIFNSVFRDTEGDRGEKEGRAFAAANAILKTSDARSNFLANLLKQKAELLDPDRANLREADPKNRGERCSFCQYFDFPTTCSILDSQVAMNQVCDWIQSRGDVEGAPKYKIAERDWLAFVQGMIEKQPYQHKVLDGAITPEGPLVLIEDTSTPKHRFSLSFDFHVGHTSLEHHWTQDEVDRLVSVGKAKESKGSGPHSYSKCMECSASPTVELLWAEGMGRAWFCAKHYHDWANTKNNHDGYGHASDIVAEHKVRWGVVARRWRDGPVNRKDSESWLATHKSVLIGTPRNAEEDNKRILENRKTKRARKRHTFRPAKYTHPNGHPRCALCGHSEYDGSICVGVDNEDSAPPRLGPSAAKSIRATILGLEALAAGDFVTLDELRAAVSRKPADNFFEVTTDGSAKDLGEGRPDVAPLREGNKNTYGLVIENRAGGSNQVSLFRADSQQEAVERAERKVESDKLPRLILGKAIGIRDNRLIFRDLAIFSFEEEENKAVLSTGDFGGPGQAPLSIRQVSRPPKKYRWWEKPAWFEKDDGEEPELITSLKHSERAEKEANHDGMMVAIFLPSQIGVDLALKDGEDRSELHITLGYFGEAKDVDNPTLKTIIQTIQEVAKEAASFKVTVSGVGTFPPSESSKGETPFYAKVDSPGLMDFRAKLIKALEAAGAPVDMTHPDYSPHITLKYLKEGENAPTDSVGPVSFDVAAVYLSVAKSRQIFTLGGVNSSASEEVDSEVHQMGIWKAEEERRYTFGVVYKASSDTGGTPETDAHNEFVTATELQLATWGHVQAGDRRIYVQHGQIPGLGFKKAGEWVEIVAWPHEQEVELFLPTGERHKSIIPAGSVYMGVIWEPFAWEMVKKGLIRGFSFGGLAGRVAA